jgi:uncharacterized membrane protein YesL
MDMVDRYYDNPVIRILNRCTDLVVLNLLFLLCCIPVVTIGAATTAMASVTLRSVRYGDGYVVQNFFRAFRENFRQSTRLWLLILLFGGMLVLDFLFWNGEKPSVVTSTMKMVTVALGLLGYMVFVWLVPLMAKTTGTLREQIGNAIKMAVGYFFPYTVVCMGLPILAAYLAYINGPMLMLMMVMGFATVSYICSFFIYRVFANHMEEESLGSEDVLYPLRKKSNEENEKNGR